jgi:hypothetical protein
LFEIRASKTIKKTLLNKFQNVSKSKHVGATLTNRNDVYVELFGEINIESYCLFRMLIACRTLAKAPAKNEDHNTAI